MRKIFSAEGLLITLLVGLHLFIFVRGAGSEETRAAEKTLADPQVRALFSNTVNCRLDWDTLADRNQAAAYGVDAPPACVIVRPDGTYHRRTGALNRRALEELVAAAAQPGARPIRRAPSP